MKQLVIISGKGGTGKTIISASFASLAKSKVMADCDVDAANLYLLLKPKSTKSHQFSGGKQARINQEECTVCGACIEVCRFDAIRKTNSEDIVIDPLSCEGCAVCSHICPPSAIKMEDAISGEWFISQTSYGPFVHARLGIGEESSGKLVSEVRKNAKDIAEKENLEYVIIDGPPGIGCPVIASLSGTDLALIVTEPSPSGIHDMKRVIETARHFNIKTACCINKFDINLQNTTKIENWCRENSIPLLGKIPYDPKVTEAMVRSIPLVEYGESSTSGEIKKIWKKIHNILALET